MSKLKPGDPAPEFTLIDQNEQSIRLADFKGKKVLIYFYPKADTPGCTTQSCAVSDAIPDLSALGTAALGISPDAPSAQRKFDEKHRLGFPLLSDTELSVAKAFGAFGEKTMFGKKKEGIIRSAFLLDEEGIVRGAWYNVKPDATVPKAMAALGAASANK